MTHTTLNDTNAPTIWPACDCGVTYVFRRGMSMTGFHWVWMADCKHPKKEAHPPRLMTAAGPYDELPCHGDVTPTGDGAV